MPDWVTSGREDAHVDAAFLSGAALATLHLILRRAEIPQSLLRDRLALGAAVACAGFAGRPEREPELRDAMHLARPGEALGPAGDIFRSWRRAVGSSLSGRTLHRALPELSAERLTYWLGAGQGGPVARAAGVLEAVLAEYPRAEGAALILADAALARALGWEHLVPLLATGLKSRDLRLEGVALEQACHRAILRAVGPAVAMATDLARRAARLEALAPKLRAKGAEAALALFLRNDALSPSLTLTGVMSDRAARRLCDRLVDLGGVRELTGRDSFRLYGL